MNNCNECEQLRKRIAELESLIARMAESADKFFDGAILAAEIVETIQEADGVEVI